MRIRDILLLYIPLGLVVLATLFCAYAWFWR